MYAACRVLCFDIEMTQNHVIISIFLGVVYSAWQHNLYRLGHACWVMMHRLKGHAQYHGEKFGTF